MTVYTEKAPPYTHEKTADIVKYFQEILEQIPAKCWVAGGAVLSSYLEQPIKDIDLYFPNKENWKLAKDFFIGLDPERTYDGENSFKLKLGGSKEPSYRDADKSVLFNNTFDLVSNWRKTPSSTIKSFDIVACCFSVDGDGVLYYVDGAFSDIENKMIRWNKTHDFVGPEERIMQRINKYGRKGFELSVEEATRFLKVMEKVRSKPSLFGVKKKTKAKKLDLGSF
jgi:hypothetical protein